MDISALSQQGFKGEIHNSKAYRFMYATDASIYKELPASVLLPADEEDLRIIVNHAYKHDLSIIPRAAGTSLAGQCVGNGIVVDCSNINQVLSLDPEIGVVQLQPGVVRDELNLELKAYGLFFGPNTSTSNRCMMAGMVGNNSSGSTSVKYGVTRDKVREIDMILSDGSVVTFGEWDAETWKKKLDGEDLEGAICRQIHQLLTDTEIQNEIQKKYPANKIHRRNSGYALDELSKFEMYGGDSKTINLSKLICGSEGTLGLMSRIELALDPVPPVHTSLMLLQYESIDKALRAVPSIMKQSVYACELMDRTILECAAKSKSQEENIKLVKGLPEAILMVQLHSATEELLMKQETELKRILESNYSPEHISVIYPPDIDKAWNLRKAGLGILSNIPGDRHAIACIEDTAVDIDILADYIAEFEQLLKRFGQEAVYYAHAGAGEIHLRPILNFTTKEGIQTFKDLTQNVARLVRKYNGSLSGEHGDGRVRAPYLEEYYGPKLYEAFRKIKYVFDPKNIFNPGKIVDPKSIESDLRYKLERADQVMSFYDFGTEEDIFQHLERCNGSGDCRVSHQFMSGMCPTYHASKEEKYTTRARANLMRELWDDSSELDILEPDVVDSMGTCISCKACVRECPSGIDMARIKSEYLYRKISKQGLRLRDRIFTESHRLMPYLNVLPAKSFLINSVFSKRILNAIGITPYRNMPLPAGKSLARSLPPKLNQQRNDDLPRVLLFVDEFIEGYDRKAGIAVHEILAKLGYGIRLVTGLNSGRAHISRGLLDKAKQHAVVNVNSLSELIKEEDVIVGIEPSAILTFRDEYKYMLPKDVLARLNSMMDRIFVFEEFLIRELEEGRIKQSAFKTKERIEILYHGHCHQKALSNVEHVLQLLNLPESMSASLIDSGCCGMAGSFGYEKEHYELSMSIAEQRLFKAIRERKKGAIVCASGMSCRHQIHDGLGLKAYHPSEILLGLL